MESKRMPVSRASIVLAACLAAPLAAQGEAEHAFTFTEVREGVYHAVGSGEVAAGSNSAIVVGDDDVLLVDSHMTPAAARALLAELPRITDKPVRWVVNTHFHFDHVQGNQVFADDVEIVAHEETWRRVADGDSRRGRAYDHFIGAIPERIAGLEAELATAEGEERATVEGQIERLSSLWEQDQEVELTPPTIALSRAVTLYRGEREIRLLYLGRGHTSGDVVVYLPKEKALVTGDLVTAGLPYMGDAHLDEWSATLAELETLDVEVVLPGHGPAFEEVERIGHLRAYVEDLWAQIQRLHAEGVPAAEAAERVDLTAHADHFPQIEGPGVFVHTVDRAYELLDGASD